MNRVERNQYRAYQRLRNFACLCPPQRSQLLVCLKADPKDVDLVPGMANRVLDNDNYVVERHGRKGGPGLDAPSVGAESLVRVEDHIYLADVGTGAAHSYNSGNGVIASNPGLCVIFCSTSSGFARLFLELWEDPPAALDVDAWDEVVDHSVESRTGHMIVSPMGDTSPGLPELTPSGPGHYRIRVHARGRDIDPDGVASEPNEEYLFAVWPAGPQADVIHKQTDHYGAEVRAWPPYHEPQ